MKTLIVVLVLLGTVVYADTKVTSAVYELDSKRATKLFTEEINLKDEANGITSSEVTYNDVDGKPAFVEKGHVKGDQIVDFTIDQLQTGEKAKVEVKDGKVNFSYDKGDRHKENSEKVDGDVLSTVNFNAYVLSHWDTLVAKKDVDVRFAVWDRQETVGFTLRSMGEEEVDGKKCLHLKMKATSFVISALVDPIHMWYEMDTHHLHQLKGRVAPKKKSGSSWKDLDAEVVYGY